MITRPALRLVQFDRDAHADWAWFCGHCAAPPPGFDPPAPTARVCDSCGLGLLLETRREVVPAGGDAFLVVDSRMTVQAMSIEAEQLLATDEALAINRPVTELLVPADAEAGSASGLARAIGEALGGGDPLTAFARPWNTFGVRMHARIAACGPPRAALIVLRGTAPAQPAGVSTAGAP